MGFADLLILAVVAVLFILAVVFAVKHRNSECGGDCSSCPYHAACRKPKKK